MTLGIYLNNAATSYPKPDIVCEETIKFLKYGGMNHGRGSTSEKELLTMQLVYECRENITDFFSADSNSSNKGTAEPRFVTFTSNVTESLNIILKGYLKPGMRVLTSGMEHNAIVRPLHRLEAYGGVKVDVAGCREDGELCPETVTEFLSASNYDLMVISHASNVCGTVQNIADISSICHEFGVPFVIDSAQTAGIIPLDVNSNRLSALCFTGHKGLMGPQGIGGIVWGNASDGANFSLKVDPLIEGGTGSYSHMEVQPEEMPDKFESGTLNLPGIAGLNAAIKWISKTGIEIIAAHERELGALLLSELRDIPGLHIYGKKDMTGRLPVISFNIKARGSKLPVLQSGFYDNGVLAGRLSAMGFETRPGLHCSPFSHKTLRSFPEGSLRVSPGYYNTQEDIESFIKALKKVVS